VVRHEGEAKPAQPEDGKKPGLFRWIDFCKRLGEQIQEFLKEGTKGPDHVLDKTGRKVLAVDGKEMDVFSVIEKPVGQDIKPGASDLPGIAAVHLPQGDQKFSHPAFENLYEELFFGGKMMIDGPFGKAGGLHQTGHACPLIAMLEKQHKGSFHDLLPCFLRIAHESPLVNRPVGLNGTAWGGGCQGGVWTIRRGTGILRPMQSLVLTLDAGRAALVEVDAAGRRFVFFDVDDLRGPWILEEPGGRDLTQGEITGSTHTVRMGLRFRTVSERQLEAWRFAVVEVRGVLEVDGEVFTLEGGRHALREAPDRLPLYVSLAAHRFEHARPGSFSALLFPKRGLLATGFRGDLSWHTPDFHLQDATGRHHVRPFRWRYVLKTPQEVRFDLECWAPERHLVELATPSGYRYVSAIAHAFLVRETSEGETHRYYANHTVFLDVHTDRRIPLSGFDGGPFR